VLLAATFGRMGVASAATVTLPGDLLLGFYDYSASTQTALNTNSYVVDLGPLATVTASSHALALGNIAADLSNIFGSGWASDPNLTWGIATYTGSGSAKTLYGTAQEPTFGTMANAWGGVSFSAGTNGTAANNILAVGNQINNGLIATTGTIYTASTNASVLAVEQANADPNSFFSWQPPGKNSTGQSFGIYSGGIDGSGAATNVSGVTGTALDLFKTTTGGVGSYDGTFTINSSGQVSYSTSVPSAAPEPGRAALLLFGFGLIVVRRRRSVSAL